MKKIYSGVLRKTRRLADSAIDLGYAVRQGLILGYYDAKNNFHRTMIEGDIEKIVKNAAIILLASPGGTILSPLYLTWRGSMYLIRKARKQKRTR